MFIYILISEKSGKYYIGQSENVEKRITMHNSLENKSFTRKDQPWKLVIKFSCNSRLQARKIENHIKKMKSRKYIINLINNEEIFRKLKMKYSSSDC